VRREVGGSDTQAHRDWEVEAIIATDPGMPIQSFRKPERVSWGNPQFAAGGREPVDHNVEKQWQLSMVLQPLDLARK